MLHTYNFIVQPLHSYRFIKHRERLFYNEMINLNLGISLDILS